MEPAVRHRLLLSLRSEQALGLRAIPRGTIEMPAEISEVPEPAPVVPRVAPPQPASRPARSEPAMLYGQPATPPAKPVNPPTAPAFDAPSLTLAEKRARLAAMEEKEVRTCPKCRLCQTRTQTVFGEGDPDAKIFFIGEGPGENEDLTGRPFVGRAGQLLDKMIAAMGLRREQVYIANIVKCRP
ncbi:MAG TPA: uracil-DNA glycosylase family protein, partial [Tepidisphaeraceae bacterium]|nr:uracil-DNA glycosylase family protein [Tepidisphaeraceae bacterium]